MRSIIAIVTLCSLFISFQTFADNLEDNRKPIVICSCGEVSNGIGTYLGYALKVSRSTPMRNRYGSYYSEFKTEYLFIDRDIENRHNEDLFEKCVTLIKLNPHCPKE